LVCQGGVEQIGRCQRGLQHLLRHERIGFKRSAGWPIWPLRPEP
jgi:hypothetical protein